MSKKRNLLKRNSGFVVGCAVAAVASFFTVDAVMSGAMPVNFLVEEETENREIQSEPAAEIPEETRESRTYETDNFTVLASGAVVRGVETEAETESEGETEPQTDENGNVIENGETDADGNLVSDGSGSYDSSGMGDTAGNAGIAGADTGSSGGGTVDTGNFVTGSEDTGASGSGTGDTGGSAGSSGSSGGTGNAGSSSGGTGSSGGSSGNTGYNGGEILDTDGNITIWAPESSDSVETYPDTPETSAPADTGDTIISGISSRYISESELYNYDLGQLRLIRNEIFALHGRIFNSQDLRDYFSRKSWYVPVYSPEEFDANMFSFLNEYEKANLQVILDYEAALGGY